MVALSEQGQTHTFISTFFCLSAMRSSATFVFPVPISMKRAPTLRRLSLLTALCWSSVAIINQFLRYGHIDMGGKGVGRVKWIARAEELLKLRSGDGL